MHDGQKDQEFTHFTMEKEINSAQRGKEKVQELQEEKKKYRSFRVSSVDAPSFSGELSASSIQMNIPRAG